MNEKYDILYKSLLENGTLTKRSGEVEKKYIKPDKDIHVNLFDIKKITVGGSANFTNMNLSKAIYQSKTGINIFELTDIKASNINLGNMQIKSYGSIIYLNSIDLGCGKIKTIEPITIRKSDDNSKDKKLGSLLKQFTDTLKTNDKYKLVKFNDVKASSITIDQPNQNIIIYLKNCTSIGKTTINIIRGANLFCIFENCNIDLYINTVDIIDKCAIEKKCPVQEECVKTICPAQKECPVEKTCPSVSVGKYYLIIVFLIFIIIGVNLYYINKY